MGTALPAAANAIVERLLAALVIVLLVLATQARGSAPAQEDILLASTTGGDFSISGHVQGLYPGKATRIRLVVHNPNRFAIRVKSITVGVGNAGSLCSAKNVVVGSFSGSLRVTSGHSQTLRLPIRMRAGAPDSCSGKKFRLSYRGRAVKA